MRSTYAETEFGDVHYLEAGSGPAVLFLHPIGLRADVFLEGINLLAGDRRVVAPDLPGHGQSYRPAAATLSVLSDGITGFCEEVGLLSTAVMGVSLGGMIGQRLAAGRVIDVSDLLLISTVGRADESLRRSISSRIRSVQSGGMSAVWEEVAARWFEHRTVPAQDWESRTRDAMLATNPDVHAAILDDLANLDLLQQNQEIQARVAVLVGVADRGTPRAKADEITQSIPGATTVELPVGSHMMAVEYESLVFEYATAFFRGDSPPEIGVHV